MADIKPRDPSLLTDEDVEYAHFRCCGDEDLVFLRCPSCGHIWVQCYECDTWYTDLQDLTKTEGAFISSTEERVNCPRCNTPFEDFYYLMEDFVDKYLPTAEQVIEAGFGKHLARHQREKHGVRGAPVLLETLRKLEVSLHDPAVRAKPEAIQALLHPSFREFGRSGSCYTYESIVCSVAGEGEQPSIWSQDFEVQLLSEGVALLTYRSAHVNSLGQLERHTNRSSVWQQTQTGWKMRFHQGTPTSVFERCDLTTPSSGQPSAAAHVER